MNAKNASSASTNDLSGSDIEQEFSQTVADIKNSTSTKPLPQNLKLKMYALYKQATEGDVSGSKPSMIDMVGRAKYKAWAELKGKSQQEAKSEYVKCYKEEARA